MSVQDQNRLKIKVQRFLQPLPCPPGTHGDSQSLASTPERRGTILNLNDFTEFERLFRIPTLVEKALMNLTGTGTCHPQGASQGLKESGHFPPPQAWAVVSMLPLSHVGLHLGEPHDVGSPFTCTQHWGFQ